MHDANYRPLKDYVARRGGLRLTMHGGLRDQVVEQIVADWPTDCPIERVEEVVAARIRLKVRKRYGSVLGMIVLSAFIKNVLLVRMTTIDDSKLSCASFFFAMWINCYIGHESNYFIIVY